MKAINTDFDVVALTDEEMAQIHGAGLLRTPIELPVKLLPAAAFHGDVTSLPPFEIGG